MLLCYKDMAYAFRLGDHYASSVSVRWPVLRVGFAVQYKLNLSWLTVKQNAVTLSDFLS